MLSIMMYEGKYREGTEASFPGENEDEDEDRDSFLVLERKVYSADSLRENIPLPLLALAAAGAVVLLVVPSLLVVALLLLMRVELGALYLATSTAAAKLLTLLTAATTAFPALLPSLRATDGVSMR